MTKDRPAIIERLNNLYNTWYDITPGDLGSGLPLEALCIYRSRSEKYVLSKKAKLWAVEANEYLYLYNMAELDLFQAEKCISFAIEDALPRIKPHKEHMYSFITAVFVADTIEDDAIRYIRRRKFNKTYKLGFFGSSPLKTAIIDTRNDNIVTNNMGRDLRKQINKIIKG